MYGGNGLITGTAITTFDNLTLLGSNGVVKQQTINANTTGVLQLNSVELATDVNTMLVTNPLNTAITFNNGAGYASSVSAGRLVGVTNGSSHAPFPTGSPAGYSGYSNSIFYLIQITPAGAWPILLGFA